MSRSVPSSLSSSLESLSSLRSSCSTRSAMEREKERRERRRLLDLSINKIQGANVPLRKHLLVYNAAKVLQKDLDVLDEEDLYATLMSPLNSTMEVDNWATFSEEALVKGGDCVVEKMEVEESTISTSSTIWQWMDSSREEDYTTKDHQEWLGVSVSSGTPTWSLFSGMGMAWSSTFDDSLSSSSSLPSYGCGLWDEMSLSSSLSSRDLLHLLPIEA